MKKIKTTPMSASWYSALKESGCTIDSVFRHYNAEELKAKLLAVGGQAVILMGNLPRPKTLLNKGEWFLGADAKMWKLREGKCHDNVEYIMERYPKFQGFTGFALSEDGCWRYHSWAFDPVKSCVRETTEPRLIYYGIPY